MLDFADRGAGGLAPFRALVLHPTEGGFHPPYALVQEGADLRGTRNGARFSCHLALGKEVTNR